MSIPRIKVPKDSSIRIKVVVCTAINITMNLLMRVAVILTLNLWVAITGNPLRMVKTVIRFRVLFPGTVNMLVITQDDGSVDAVMPDPFLRGDGEDTTADPLVAAVEALLPQGVRPHWVDDWRTYHLMWGEVHCGTNTTRTPNASWWLDAMHLIEEE